MIVSPSTFVQLLFPILGVGVALFGAYLVGSGAYRAWDRVRRDAIERAALEKKRAAEVHLAEEQAENEQLRELWSEGARERLERMREMKKRPPGSAS